MKQQLTVLSFGGGQDSMALLLLYIHDPSFRARYAPGDFLVVMADTGDEHPHTYALIDKVKLLCAQHEIPFFFLHKSMGFHRASWPDLISPQLRDEGDEYKPTLVQLRTKTCTLQLKLDPIYKFVDQWINDHYGYGLKSHPGGGCLKQAIKRFHQENGEIHVLIGFAKGEESRRDKSLKMEARIREADEDTFWKAVVREFPLIDRGMGRPECQALIATHGFKVYPSNCMRCPYMSPEELYWLFLHYPEKYDEWVLIEQRKIERFAGTAKNHGVFNTKELIPDRLAKVQKKYAHMGRAELLAALDDWKMNHGCTSGSY